MRRADIEVPNLAVDMDSRARSACYPRGSFYPLSPGPSTRCQRITWPDFRPCSACRPRSQAPLCPCTPRLISIQPEGTFGRLRYSFGGDRPSQTTHQVLSRIRITDGVRTKTEQEWYFNVASSETRVPPSPAPTYPTQTTPRSKAKLQ